MKIVDTLLEATSQNMFSWPGQQPQPHSPESRKEGVLGDKGTRLPIQEEPMHGLSNEAVTTVYTLRPQRVIRKHIF